MKKIGIVGGIAWPSTIAYYRLICAGANAHFRAQGHPPPYPAPWITIESVNMAETRALRGQPGDEASWAGFDAVFRDCFRRLQTAGCDVGLIASNTPHARLAAICQGLDLPILSILDATVTATKALGVGHALVLGTAVTMRAGAYDALLRAAGVTPLPGPEAAGIDALQHLIDTEFQKGATEAGRAALLDLCQTHVVEPADTAIVLACTELPLAFANDQNTPIFEVGAYRMVNTTAVHAQAALRVALSLDD